jgi:hypothetical protein
MIPFISGRKQTPATPLLAHIHVPKTAGSSFRKVLAERYGAAHLHLYYDNSTTFVYETAALADLVRPPAVQAFSSHFVRRFPPILSGRRVHYVSFARDPIQQFISYITYTRKHYLAIKDTVLISHLPPGMPDLTVRECAKWILDGPDGQFRNFQENYNTNFFARYVLLDSRGLNYHDPKYRAARLATARQVLSRFLLVGLSDRMDETFALLRAKAEMVGIPLPNVTIPVENVTSAERESLDWIHADDEVGRKLLSSVEEDTHLFNWSVARFESMRHPHATSPARAFISRMRSHLA